MIIDKNKYILVIVLVGLLGVHKFMAKKWIWGIGQIFMTIFYFKWAIAFLVIDLFFIIFMKTDQDGKINLSDLKM